MARTDTPTGDYANRKLRADIGRRRLQGGERAIGQTALEAVSRAIAYCHDLDRAVEKILLHPTWTTRGYVFVVETYEKLYIIANENDFNVACAAMISEGTEDLIDYCYGIRISKDEKEFQLANGGFYRCALSLE